MKRDVSPISIITREGDGLAIHGGGSGWIEGTGVAIGGGSGD